MTIFALDDEPLTLARLKESIEKAAPDASVTAFANAFQALAEIEEKGVRPDIVFTDIELPGISGIELARRLKSVPNARTNIVFVTAYSEYALDATTLHASGYVMKPFDVDAIRREIEDLRYPPQNAGNCRVRAQCFGGFDVFADGAPLRFRYAKTKEFLAYLIDRRGSAVNSEELCLILWETEENSVARRSHLRNLVADLRSTLKQYGVDDILRFSRNSFAVNPDHITCDYYRFLQGDPNAQNAFTGEYMTRYSWAEVTLAALLELHANRNE